MIIQDRLQFGMKPIQDMHRLRWVKSRPQTDLQQLQMQNHIKIKYKWSRTTVIDCWMHASHQCIYGVCCTFHMDTRRRDLCNLSVWSTYECGNIYISWSFWVYFTDVTPVTVKRIKRVLLKIIVLNWAKLMHIVVFNFQRKNDIRLF